MNRFCHLSIFLMPIFLLPPNSPAQNEKEVTPKVAEHGTTAAAAITANPFDAFTAFSAILNGGMGRDENRKVYRSGNLMRLDFQDEYRVTDLSSRFTWIIQPKKCVKFPMPDAGTYLFSAFRDFKVERSLTGEQETIDGHPCKIENVTFRRKDIPELVLKLKLWTAEDLNGFPVKVEYYGSGTGKAVTTYSSVVLEQPDPKLFHHPANCNKFQGLEPAQKGSAASKPAKASKARPN